MFNPVSWVRRLVSGSPDPDPSPVEADIEPPETVARDVALYPDIDDMIEFAERRGRVLRYDDAETVVVKLDETQSMTPVAVEQIDCIVAGGSPHLPDHDVFGTETPDHPVFEADEDLPDHEVFA